MRQSMADSRAEDPAQELWQCVPFLLPRSLMAVLIPPRSSYSRPAILAAGGVLCAAADARVARLQVGKGELLVRGHRRRPGRERGPDPLPDRGPARPGSNLEFTGLTQNLGQL